MSTELLMPSLGADMTSGRLLEWHVAAGEEIRKGQIVATVDTDKAEIDIETFHDGTIVELLAQPGETVEVGGVIATVAAPGEAPVAVEVPAVAAPVVELADAPASPAPAPAPVVEPPPAPPEPTLTPVVAAPPAPAPTAAPPAPAEPHRPRVSPLARRVAASLGIDVTQLTGTGPGGAVTRPDVEGAAAARGITPDGSEAIAPPEPAAAPTEPTSPHRDTGDRQASLRAAIAALMARSKREIPHYYLAHTIDMTVALAWVEAHNADAPPASRVLPAALLLRAAALAAHDVPEMNGTYVDDVFVPSERVNLGVAVSMRPSGVVAPAILGADLLGLEELMAQLRALTKRARRGALRQSDLSETTLTVTSLGEQGADLVHGVIFPHRSPSSASAASPSGPGPSKGCSPRGRRSWPRSPPTIA